MRKIERYAWIFKQMMSYRTSRVSRLALSLYRLLSDYCRSVIRIIARKGHMSEHNFNIAIFGLIYMCDV